MPNQTPVEEAPAPPPATPTADPDDPYWVAWRERSDAMTKADQLRGEAEGVIAAADAAWMVFIREYLKDRKASHA